ncbi:MAG: hypothetical protein WDA06_01400 [Phenylobacterium sp.]
MIFIAIDPGFGGAIAILDDIADTLIIHDIPVITQIKNKKKYKKYDLLSIVNILAQYDIDYISIEYVHSHKGEGSVSSFNFGRGFGSLEGIVTAIIKKEVILISPLKWKKYYPNLETNEIIELRDRQKATNAKIRDMNKDIKILKDKALKKQNKIEINNLQKDVSKIASQIKSKSKEEALTIAKQLRPKDIDYFKRKKDADRAEATLICLYLKDKYNELV